jgi:hypothetical protein
MRRSERRSANSALLLTGTAAGRRLSTRRAATAVSPLKVENHSLTLFANPVHSFLPGSSRC